MKLYFPAVLLASIVLLYLVGESQARDCAGRSESYTESYRSICSQRRSRWFRRRTTYSSCYKIRTKTRIVPGGCTGCGGCGTNVSSQPACDVGVPGRVTQTGTGTCSFRQSRGRSRWFRRARRTTVYKTCTKVQYKTSEIIHKACCSGYRLQGSTCYREGTSSPQCGVRTLKMTPRLAPKAAKKPDGTTLIVGGTNAVYGQFPWQVSLTSYGGHFCGGVLVNERFILTAAHCINTWTTSQYASRYRVVLGEHVRGPTDSRQVTATISAHRVHPSYSSSTNRHDIAMIKLTSAVTENTHVRRACLPTSTSDRVAVGTETEISGWGVTEAGPRSDNHPTATTLQFAVVRVASETSCSSVFGSLFVPSNMICATDGMGDTVISGCFGDSGGPLMVTRSSKTTVVGVTSYGSNVGCAMGRPVVYTEVAAYLSWIQSTMNSL